MLRILSIILLLLPVGFKALGQLPLPEIPTTITEPTKRADYLALHFYDAMESGSWDNQDEHEMLQDWANFLSVLPHCSDAGRREAVNKLFRTIPASAIETYANMAEDYLSSPDSELFDEPTYMLVLKALESSPSVSKPQATAYKARREYLSRALPGTTAPDIKVGTLQGALGLEEDEFIELADLVGTAKQIQIVFYDPDCEDCHARMEYLLDDSETQSRETSGDLRIVTVRITDEVEEIYPILSVPSIYILDGATLKVLSRE